MIKPPNILTIAGSDSGGGAGIQADIKTIMALGGYGVCAITALTAQNGATVAGIAPTEPDFVLLQLETVLDGFKIAAAKTGMLFSSAIIKAIAPILESRTFPLVADPVCVSQSGCKLLRDDAIQSLREFIIPNCDLLTPNIPEAEELSGIEIGQGEGLKAAGEKLLRMGAKNVLIKGGHLQNGIVCKDVLFSPDKEPREFVQAKVDTENNHGTGCTLSAAIATGLGKGLPLEGAIAAAQRYLNACLRGSYSPGIGHGPVNHALNFKEF